MAGRLDVITYGKGDTYLTVDPDMTFFHRRVTKRPNFAINYVDLKVKKDEFGLPWQPFFCIITLNTVGICRIEWRNLSPTIMSLKNSAKR